eukprot:GEMP01039478.1.p1 GENE.GEMP01039478.1~~GEMP01039478.1.p1  ORF type:complete len:424 (+),score=61.39 GEMP01039478.1:138-1409(+)
MIMPPSRRQKQASKKAVAKSAAKRRSIKGKNRGTPRKSVTVTKSGLDRRSTKCNNRGTTGNSVAMRKSGSKRRLTRRTHMGTTPKGVTATKKVVVVEQVNMSVAATRRSPSSQKSVSSRNTASRTPKSVIHKTRKEAAPPHHLHPILSRASSMLRRSPSMYKSMGDNAFNNLTSLPFLPTKRLRCKTALSKASKDTAKVKNAFALAPIGVPLENLPAKRMRNKGLPSVVCVTPASVGSTGEECFRPPHRITRKTSMSDLMGKNISAAKLHEQIQADSTKASSGIRGDEWSTSSLSHLISNKQHNLPTCVTRVVVRCRAEVDMVIFHYDDDTHAAWGDSVEKQSKNSGSFVMNPGENIVKISGQHRTGFSGSSRTLAHSISFGTSDNRQFSFSGTSRKSGADNFFFRLETGCIAGLDSQGIAGQ